MPSIINATTTNGLVTSADNSGSLQLATNSGTTAVTIDTSQNVGVGTASPADKLDIARNSGANSTGGLTLTNSSTSGYGSSVNWNLALNSVAGINGRMYCEAASSTASFMAWQTTVGGTLAERMRIDSSGNFAFNSGYGSVATAYGCRAWVNFNGTGTVSIRGSGNVSSISDYGTGYYGVNYTTSLVDGNYSAVATANEPFGTVRTACTTGNSTSNVLVFTFNGAGVLADVDVLNFAVFR